MSKTFSFRKVEKPAAAADAAAAAKPVEPTAPPVTVDPATPAKTEAPAPAADTPAPAAPSYASLKAAGLNDAQIAALGVAVPTEEKPVDTRRAALKAAGLNDAQIDIALAVPASAPAGAVPPAANRNLPAVRPQANVTEHRAPAVYQDDADELTASDVTIPRLNLVANVGKLSETHNPGELLFNKEFVLIESPKTAKEKNVPIHMVVCGFRSDRYVEKTDGTEMGEIYDTVEEVIANGGTIDWNEAKATGKPQFQRLAECVVLIELPEGKSHAAFSYVADGKRWAPALWSMKGGAYTNGAKIIRSARKHGWLADDQDPVTGTVVTRRGYTSGVWLVNTFLEKYRTGNSGWIPVFKQDRYASPELQALANKLV
jgi:hypothetical protein